MAGVQGLIGETVGEWKIVDHVSGTDRSNSTFKIECTECGEQITSRWNRFGTSHPRLCTCHPEYRGRGRPSFGETVARRPRPDMPVIITDRPAHRPDAASRRKLADDAMMRPPEMPHQARLDRMLYEARRRAIEEGMDFALTMSFLEALLVHQGGFCALSGMPISLSGPDYTASIDRKDSAYGYVPGNVQWVHRALNMMKSDHDQERFVELCAAVAQRAVGAPE